MNCFKSYYLYLATIIIFGVLSSCEDFTPGENWSPVNKEPIHITLSHSAILIDKGQQAQLKAVVSPLDANSEIIWDSDNPSVATIDNHGTITAIYYGTTKVTATSIVNANKKVVCTVTVSPNINGHAFVDLGLTSGTLWATCNVGASNPEDYGSYFSWGNVIVDSDSYSDSPISLPLKYDAARYNWGGSWRMPSIEEFQELCDECQWTWTNYDGKTYGYKVASKKNNSCIFLPAAGIKLAGYVDDAGSEGLYWSTTLDTLLAGDVRALYFSSESAGKPSGRPRNWKMTIRPVIRESVVAAGITLSMNSFNMEVGQIRFLKGRVEPSNADQNIIWKSSNESVVSINEERNIVQVKALSKGTAKIIAISGQNQNIISECLVNVKPKDSTHEYIDLGLPSGTLWATCNVGASFPEEYGDYYAWGETEAKSSYSWKTYKWCNGTQSSITKYGLSNNDKYLEAKDDVAHVKWGENWYTPTIDEFSELFDEKYCSRKLDRFNGVVGWLITSQINGNTLFLPAAGLYTQNGLVYAGSKCRYWANSLFEKTYAWSVEPDRVCQTFVYEYRYCGFNVRPVYRR